MLRCRSPLLGAGATSARPLVARAAAAATPAPRPTALLPRAPPRGAGAAYAKGKKRRSRKASGSGGDDDGGEAWGAEQQPRAASPGPVAGPAADLAAADLIVGDLEDDDIILIAGSDEESSDEGDRAALRRFVQAEDDPRFRAALAAAQAAFEASTRAPGERGGAGAAAACGWEDGEDDSYLGAADGGDSFGLDEDGVIARGDYGEDDDVERVMLVGVTLKKEQQAAAAAASRRRRGGGARAGAAEGEEGDGGGVWRDAAIYSIEESLAELGRLAETAGLKVVGSTYQVLESPNNATYIGSGKVAEVARAVAAQRVDTVIFDDELSPGQLRNLEKAFSGEGPQAVSCRVGDRTALILDIFSQRARTREGMLQVELAQTDYQLPRLTRMWSHLDRVGGGGQVKGAGEKQIEIDKRLLRDKAAALRKELNEVRRHRAAHRERRGAAPIPVVALVGYTNAGKSTLMNTLTQAGVLAEDKLFATLDPTTRKVRLRNNLEVLFSDTVGFIQKLPPQLVAAFTATLEEISDAGVVLHVLDASAPNAVAQCDAVLKVLDELRVHNVPIVTAWNKIDACPNPDAVRALAAGRSDTVVISGSTGEGVERLLEVVADTLAATMVDMELLLPYAAGDLLDDLHKTGSVRSLAYEADGARVSAGVPRHLVGKLRPYALGSAAGAAAAGGEARALSAAVAAAAGGGAFEDAGDGSLFIESSSGWSDDEEDEGEGDDDGMDGWRPGSAYSAAAAEAGAAYELAYGGLGSGNLSGLAAGGAPADEEDDVLAATRRHLEQQRAAAAPQQRRRRKQADRRAEEAARRLLAHRLPEGWDEAVQGGGGGAAGGGREAAGAVAAVAGPRR